MKWNRSGKQLIPITLLLALSFFAGNIRAQAQQSAETYQTLHLTHLTQERDARDIVTDLRNMLPKAKIYYVSSQNAISIYGSPEDVQLAQKIVSDIDREKKTYRLTYSITETDNGKQVGTQHFAFTVASGEKTTFKQGIRVPIVTGDTSAQNSSQVQYLDVGMNIQAALDGYADGLRLQTKVEQSRIAEERSGIGAQDPIIHQTMMEDVSTLEPGKPVLLGTLDIPGTTRRQEIGVVSELVR